MKVWICSDGHYSDYKVTAVYTDEQVAKQVSAAYGWSNEPQGMELDPVVPDEVRARKSYFRVAIWEDGEVSNTEKQTPGVAINYWSAGNRSRFPAYKKIWMFTTWCWADDEAHAIKIANERRIIAIATGHPPKPKQ